MKRIFVKLVVVLFIIGLAGSCADDDFVADADGDAFIVSRITGQGAEADTVFGLALHAFGNKDFSKAEATAPGGTKIQLQPYNGYAYDYYYEADEEQFSETLPETGSYSFAFSYRTGESSSATDELSEDVLYPARITKCEYNATNLGVDLAWEALADAQYYVIFMEDADGDVVYVSERLGESVVSYTISESAKGLWTGDSGPSTGTSYTFVINAYRYENGVVDLNIQAKSIATATSVWGAAN